jgi:hypothetical protein
MSIDISLVSWYHNYTSLVTAHTLFPMQQA